MKRRSLRITRYIIAALMAALIGITIYKAVVASEVSDNQLEYIDRKIAGYEAKSADYRKARAEIKKLKSDAETEIIVKKTAFDTISGQKMTPMAFSGIVKTEEQADGLTAVASGNDGICTDNDGITDTPDHSGSVADQALGQVVMSPEEFRYHGVIDWGGWRYTYYSEYVLPGEGLNIPGRWSDGNFVRDENGCLCVASNEHPYGSIVATPFGDAIVYDAIGDGVTGIIDIYVSF